MTSFEHGATYPQPDTVEVILADGDEQVLVFSPGDKIRWWQEPRFPAGPVCPGETADTAARRIVNEQVGLQLGETALHLAYNNATEVVGLTKARKKLVTRGQRLGIFVVLLADRDAASAITLPGESALKTVTAVSPKDAIQAFSGKHPPALGLTGVARRRVLSLIQILHEHCPAGLFDDDNTKNTATRSRSHKRRSKTSKTRPPDTKARVA